MLIDSFNTCTHLSTFIYVRSSSDRYNHITYKLESRNPNNLKSLWCRAKKRQPEGTITEFQLQTFIFASIMNLTLVCFVSNIFLLYIGVSFWIKYEQKSTN